MVHFKHVQLNSIGVIKIHDFYFCSPSIFNLEKDFSFFFVANDDANFNSIALNDIIGCSNIEDNLIPKDFFFCSKVTNTKEVTDGFFLSIHCRFVFVENA